MVGRAVFEREKLTEARFLPLSKRRASMEIVARSQRGSVDSDMSAVSNIKGYAAAKKARPQSRMSRMGGRVLRYLRERLFLKEAIIYLAFMIIFASVSLSSRPGSHAYYFTEAMRDFFVDEEFTEDDSPNVMKNLMAVGSHDEMWQWLQGPFVGQVDANGTLVHSGNLFWDEDYNGEEHDTETAKYVFGQNRIIGAIRLRQLRVRSDSCEIADRFKGIFDECYGDYNDDATDKSEFLGIEYQTHSELENTITWGRLDRYGGGGHVVDLPPNSQEAAALLDDIKSRKFVDKATRALFVDFSVYNVNLNLFCVVHILFEMPGTGYVIPLAQFRTVRLYRYLFNSDYVLGAFEVLFTFFVLYYVVEEITELWQNGPRAYFKAVWNYFDLANLALFLMVIAIRVYVVNIVYNRKIDLADEGYLNFAQAAFWMQQEINVNSFNALLCWIKVFKYLKISQRLSQLSRTLGYAATDLVTFLAMFVIVFLGFSHMAYMAFGDSMRDFRNFGNSMLTLFQAMVGTVNFEGLDSANRFLGPVFYMGFMVLVFLIMMNMFLAIVSAAYTTILIQDEQGRHEFDFGGFVSAVVETVKERWNARFSAETRERAASALDDFDDEGDGVDKDELREAIEADANLRELLHGETVEDLMSMYDVDGDGNLDANELNELQTRLRSQAPSPSGLAPLGSTNSLNAPGMSSLNASRSSIASSRPSSAQSRTVNVPSLGERVRFIESNVNVLLRNISKMSEKLDTVIASREPKGLMDDDEF